MKTMYDFYSDPSHGWLKVSLKELVSLGIESDISRYSYIKGENAYLEEDCDMPKFVKAKYNSGVTHIKYREHVARERYSKIRSYYTYMDSTVHHILEIE